MSGEDIGFSKAKKLTSYPQHLSQLKPHYLTITPSIGEEGTKNLKSNVFWSWTFLTEVFLYDIFQFHLHFNSDSTIMCEQILTFCIVDLVSFLSPLISLVALVSTLKFPRLYVIWNFSYNNIQSNIILSFNKSYFYVVGCYFHVTFYHHDVVVIQLSCECFCPFTGQLHDHVCILVFVLLFLELYFQLASILTNPIMIVTIIIYC